jgi:type I restriction enzyme R subunit
VECAGHAGEAIAGIGGKRFRSRHPGRDAKNHRRGEQRLDVLAYVAYTLPPVTREERAEHARVHINSTFNAKQQSFLDFVLSHYASVGVEELNQEKLKPLLLIKYQDAVQHAVTDLGQPDEIGKIFAGFQKYLYAKPVV